MFASLICCSDISLISFFCVPPLEALYQNRMCLWNAGQLMGNSLEGFVNKDGFEEDNIDGHVSLQVAQLLH